MIGAPQYPLRFMPGGRKSNRMGYLERRKHENSEKIAWLLSFVLIVSTVFGNVNLKAMAAEATTLTITIEDNTGVDGNYVEYSTNNGESWTKVQSDTGYTLAEANAELADDSEFKIRAVRGDNIQVECSDVAGFTESDFGGITGENGGIFKLKEKTAYSLKVSFMSNNQGEGGNQGNQDNFDLGGADSIENGIFTKTDGGTATLKVGDTMYGGNDSSIRVPALDTTIVVRLTANEGKKGVLRFGGGSSLAFREDMITTDGQTTTYTFTLSGIGVTDLNAAFVALNIDFEDTQPGGGGGGPEPGGSSDAISLVIEGDALNLVNNGVTVEYSTDGGSKWISITTNTTLDPIVDSAKVKVMFDSDNVMVQGDIAAGGSVTSGTVYDITQKQQYRIQIDKKVYTVVWAYGYPNSFGTDATVTNGKVEIISAVKSGETETWSGIEPTDIPGANNNNQTAEGGRVAIIPGSTVTVKIVPDYGYQFIEGMLNGQAIAAQDEISTFTFTMPNTNLHLSALFTETQDVIDCTATGVTGGSITGGENVIDSGNLQLSVTDAGISDAEKNKLKESTAASGVQVDQWLEVDLMQFVEKGDTGEQ